MLVEARRNPGFGQVLDRSDAVLPDGMPLVWLMRQAGSPRQERLAGMDLLPALCAAAAREAIGIYFLGSTPEVLSRMQRRLKDHYPMLRVVGMESPPFRELTAEEERAISERINDANPGFVFIALGCPRQELWMHRNLSRVRSVMVGLGAAFPVYAGLRGRAPRALQRMGLEWLYRLCQEPGRLWKRYLVTNTYFVCWTIRACLEGRIGRSHLGAPSREPGTPVA
jgi:N-acetylglucosaminyldiphosphoundecaprenol N-acetyl-beta-D-mannosaminyltransferase